MADRPQDRRQRSQSERRAFWIKVMAIALTFAMIAPVVITVALSFGE